MTGNIPDLTNPKVVNGYVYPIAQFTTDELDIEPSIRGKQLYIPIRCVFL